MEKPIYILIFISLLILLVVGKKMESPTTFAYSIYYENSCSQGSIANVQIYPVYGGSNGTCLKISDKYHFNYMRAACGKDSATIYTFCFDSNCQYCDAVYTWKFHKNECGMVDVGCGNIPQISTPLMYNSEYEFTTDDTQNSCSGRLYSVSGEELNRCEQVTGKEFEKLACNQTTWVRSAYLHSDTCSPDHFDYSTSGPIGTCQDQSILSCGKV